MDDEKYFEEFTKGIVFKPAETIESSEELTAENKKKKDRNKLNIAGKLLEDNNSKPIVNTRINLINEKGEIIRTAISNSQGAFVFTDLPADQIFSVHSKARYRVWQGPVPEGQGPAVFL